jgi:hypothetical protein
MPILGQSGRVNAQPTPLVQTGRSYENRPMVRRITNEEIEKQQQLAAQKQFETTQNQAVVSRLGSRIRSSFSIAVMAKSTVMQRMLQCLRQRDGIYEADVQQLIKQSNGTNIYMMITDVKCRALESWLKDIMLPAGEKPYSVEPTPVPDIPPQIIEKARNAFAQDFITRAAQQAFAQGVPPGQFNPRTMINPEEFRAEAEKFKSDLLKTIKEQAKQDADNLEEYIHDELVEGKWYDALGEFIEDFATYPTAFLEGPLYRKRAVLSWVPIQGTMLSRVTVIDKIVKEYDRVDPYDAYPAPGAKTIQDGDFCIRKRYTRRDLNAMRGVEGYDENAINQVLEKYKNGYKEYIAYDTDIADLHDRPQESMDPEGHIDGIKFFGSVQGFELREWGMSAEQVPDPYREYPIIAHMVGSYVIGARLNPHPLGRRNIYSASFRHKNGSIWGKALPEVMRDVQNICNASARSICNNAAIASGPQVWQLVDLIPAEEDRTNIYPWKIWSFSSGKLKSAAQAPMGFWQPQLIVEQLLGVYKYFFDQGSEVTGIPAYIYGNEKIGGAGATASGLSMLMNAAAKGLRNAASNIDKGVISPSVEEHWLTIMLTRPDLAKGDCRIMARASEYLVQQEQLQMRRNEFLQATNNPLDSQITGIDGRMEILRENAKSLKMDPDKIVPKREDMIANMVQQQIQEIIGKLAQQLQVPPEQVMAMLQAPAPGAGGQPPVAKAQELGPDGQPMGGQAVNQFQGRAEGGPVAEGTPYVVGEKGPEIFIPNQGGQVISNEDLQRMTILDQVLKENPGLANVHSLDDVKIIFASPERTAASKKYGGGQLEYWPKEETGTQDYPHPTGGSHKVLEIFSDDLKKNPELLKRSVAADLLHGMDKDPYYNQLREEFIGNYLPETLAFEESKGRPGVWGKEGENRYSRHDAYIRAKIVGDDMPGYTGWSDELYSEKQKGIITDIKTYLKTGKKKEHNKHGKRNQ